MCGIVFARLPGYRPDAGETRSVPGRDSGRSLPSDPIRSGAGTDARLSDRLEEPAPDLGLVEERRPRPEPRRMDKNDWLIMALGLATAGLAFVIGFVKHIFSTFMVLVHEMGHTIFGWIFGYPSLPAFDLVYGGGITLRTQRSTLLVIVIYALLGLAVFSRRRNISAVVLLGGLGVLHAILAFTSMHRVVILFMGHGTELAIASIFIYRALSGAAVSDAVERPLYAAIGFFIVFADTAFAYRLMTSSYHRSAYEGAKGGGHWMDFSRIAEQYLHTDLTVPVTFFFVCCFFSIITGYLLFRYQEYIRAAITRVWAKGFDRPRAG
jgi:hypothetical protein